MTALPGAQGGDGGSPAAAHPPAASMRPPSSNCSSPDALQRSPIHSPAIAALQHSRGGGINNNTFLTTYESLQRPQWSSEYVDLAALIRCVRQMEAKLAALRYEERRLRHHHRRHSPRQHRSGGRQQQAAAAGGASSPISRNIRSEGYLPALALAPPAADAVTVHSSPPAAGDAPSSASSTPRMARSRLGGGSRTCTDGVAEARTGVGQSGEGHRKSQSLGFKHTSSPDLNMLSSKDRSSSLDWIPHIRLPTLHVPTMQNVASATSLGGLASHHGHGRSRSDSNASGHSAASSSTHDNCWVQPGSDQHYFCALLDAEIEKATLFYLAELGRVADVLRELAADFDGIFGDGGATTAFEAGGGTSAAVAAGTDNEQIPSTTTSHGLDGSLGEMTPSVTADRVEPLLGRYRALGATLADLHIFVASNLTAVRKVLAWHDRAVVPNGKPLVDWYFRTRRRGEMSHLECLWGHRGLGSVYGSWRNGFQVLCWAAKVISGEGGAEIEGAIKAGEGRDVSEDMDEHIDQFVTAEPSLVCIEAVAVRMRDAEHRTVQDLVVFGSVGNTLALEPTVLAEHVDDNDWDLAYYALQRDGLRGITDFGDLEGVGGKGGADFVGAEIGFGGSASGSGMDYYLPLGLNLFSTFLYMTNYFIAGPTSAVYIETLGGHKALAGMVIGATPWAAMVSAFIFSIWTNHNFKRPLLFSGACLCIGNLLYGCALRFESIELVLLGRLGVGLGGPRVINRRYIADTAPMESRTAVSAAFVTLSAAGTAVGPGLSAVLQRVNFTFELPFLGRVMMNGLTAPGYVMFLLWLLFTIILALTFNEPERIGLKELQNKTVSPILSRNQSFSSNREDDGTDFHPKVDRIDPQSSSMLAETHKMDERLDSSEYGQYASEGQSSNAESATNAIPVDETNLLLPSKNGVSLLPKYSAIKQAPPMPQSLEVHKGGKPLPENEDSGTLRTGFSFDSEGSKSLSCFRNFSLQVWLCIILLFVNKLTMESVMSSVPVIAGHTYDWSVTQIGALGVAMGILVVPLSICVGWASRFYEDRIILRCLLYVSLIGMIFLVDIPGLFGESPDHNGHYKILCVGPHKYIYGCLIAFGGLQCMESIIMSMLSKVVPHSLAKGVCNSGLINTETGTFGRAFGDVVVTLAGLASLDRMLNTLMVPLVCIIIGCLLMVRWWYQALAV